MTRRRRKAPPPSAPFTPDEDAKVFEICKIGLASHYWHLALPERRFGEIADRIYTLKPPRAPLL